MTNKAASGKLKNVLATYAEARRSESTSGPISRDHNKNIDYAISKIEAVNEFLRQRTDEKFMFDEEVQLLEQLLKVVACMAKFVYRMQNILDLKIKMEEQRKAEYGLANARLRKEEDKLRELIVRKAG